jgi:tetratricopeptide (TPR) repeat protein
VLEFRILGDLEALSGGRRVPLGGYREQRVLAALVVDAGRVVPVQRLTDVIWDDDPPVTAGKQVMNAVSTGDRRGEALSLDDLGAVWRLRGDYAGAAKAVQEALGIFLELARATGSSHEEASALAALGRSAIATGHTAQAEILLRQAHQIFQRSGATETGDVLAELDNLC